MTARSYIRGLFFSATLAVAATAFADSGAQGFVEQEQAKISDLLRQPASGSRDSLVNKEMAAMVDYDELTHRAFGSPCPVSVSTCTDHWKDLTEAQRTEVGGLLRKLVEKNYRKNLLKTLNYDVTYKGVKDLGSESKIRTEAKSKLKPRDPAIQVDYVVKSASAGYRVIDIVTEGSSLTKNYYDQFHKMFQTPGQGYPYIVEKLTSKINKAD